MKTFDPPKEIPSVLHLKTVCQPGRDAATCAYLLHGPREIGSVWSGWCCAKKTEHEETLRQRVIRGTINARGDNCSGPIDFTVARAAS